MQKFFLVIMGLILSFSAFSNVQKEIEYDQARKELLNGNSLNEIESKTLMDAWWDLKQEGIEVQAPHYSSAWKIADQIRFLILSEKFHNIQINPKELDLRAKLIISTYRDQLEQKGYGYFIPEKDIPSPIKDFRAKTKNEIKELFFNTPIPKDSYQAQPRLFLFCRHNRLHPCLLLLKDKDGKAVVNKDEQTLWHQPALAASKYELPYNIRNGYTPSGVQKMDGVMPYANAPVSYGKYRRVILNWVAADKSELITKTYLPQSAHDKVWWQEASVSRDVGRSLLRIHGTGATNILPDSFWYPHVRTSGCVSQREGDYLETYNDQRLLLDTIMMAQGLKPSYDNEAKIRGIFYVIELDDEQGPVSYLDILSYLY